jgi:hypothetical protein
LQGKGHVQIIWLGKAAKTIEESLFVYPNPYMNPLASLSLEKYPSSTSFFPKNKKPSLADGFLSDVENTGFEPLYS